VSDAWDDEGFGPEDDWEGSESVAADLEDDAPGGYDELDDAKDEDPQLGEDD
jgi:hypothetical protein